MSAHPIIELTSEASWAMIEDKFSPYAKETLAKLITFLREEVWPSAKLAHAQLPTNTALRWNTVIPVIEELKAKAKKRGLWNLFLSKAHYPKHGVPLTNLEYAVMAELLGRVGHVAAQSVNCSAPDTGNMEVLARYGSPEQQKKWLVPLLNGEIRSAFAMTERFVSSSDAKNIRTSIRREGNDVIISGHKWWISGAGDPRTKVHLVMGNSHLENSSAHGQHSVVIVPADAPGVNVIRPMQVLGYDDAPEGHCEIIYDNVRVPMENIILGWGRGFEIIQGRLGPGRIHHCMRSIGAAQAALDLMIQRITDPSRKTFGKFLYEHGTVIADIAKCRAEIEQARLLVLSAAIQIDKYRAKGALKEIGMAKFVVPSMALGVVDRAMQAFGAEGLSQDQSLAMAWANLRTLRIADGPDAVHIQQVGQRELKRAPLLRQRAEELRKREDAVLERAGLKAPRRYISSTNSKPRVPPEKMRALISLYHQTDSFVTLENLSARIESAFLDQDPLVQAVTPNATYTDLQRIVEDRRRLPRIGPWEDHSSLHLYQIDEAESGWSNAKSSRELGVFRALYGVDRGGKPGLEVLEESRGRIERNLEEDQRMAAEAKP